MIEGPLAHQLPPRRASDRSFGIAIAGVLALFGALPLLGGEPARPALLFASAGLIAIALVLPKLLALPNRAFAWLGQRLQRIVNPVILFALFTLVVIPIALVARWSARRRPPAPADTFWMTRDLPITDTFFRRQY